MQPNPASRLQMHPTIIHCRLTNCFSPVINIARDPRWGRLSESFGEDPFLTAELARVYVR